MSLLTHCLFLLCCLSVTFLSILVKYFSKKLGIPSVYLIQYYKIGVFLFLLPFMIKDKFDFIKYESIKSNIRLSISVIATYIWAFCLQNIPVNNAILISFFVPFLVPILSVYFLNEKIDRKTLLFALICILGVFISVGFELIYNVYYILLLFYVFCRSINSIFIKQLSNKDKGIKHTLYYSSIIYCFFSCLGINSGTIKYFSIDLIPMIFCFVLIYHIAHYCFIKSYARSKNISTLQPFDFSRLIFSFVFSYLLLGENVNKNQIIGSLFIFTSLIFYYFLKNNKKVIF